MPHERKPADDAHEWIDRAISDLTLSQAKIENVYLEDLCFHAQQAAEKAIKAVFIYRGWRFARVHDLSALITGLLSHGLDIPNDVRECVVLTEYAVQGRYPGFDDPLSEEEYDDAVVKAECVLRWAQSLIKG